MILNPPDNIKFSRLVAFTVQFTGVEELQAQFINLMELGLISEAGDVIELDKNNQVVGQKATDEEIARLIADLVLPKDLCEAKGLPWPPETG
jgi:hypothetical protein